MQQAIGYIRISTKDQSNFSLDGQEKYIRDFAEKNNYDLLAIFRDEGQSAKNFDRPDWKELEKFVKENNTSVRFLIVSKYDRFSRNVSDALQMMEMLENRYNIRVMSVMEPIMLHPQSPYFFQFRTQMLLGAQVEWLVIRDRTEFGLHQAAKSGRYVLTAPFGYSNSRDSSNKPLIKIDETKAPVVRKMFQMYLQGAPFREIYLEVRRYGYNNTSKSAVPRTLGNPLYAGLVHVPAYYEDPEQLVKGMHEAIVPEDTWWKAQELLKGKKPQKRTIFNEEVPLRGSLKCFCGHPLTAGNSKGKKHHFWYYKCNKHPKYNHNSKRLHAQLDKIWEELSLPDAYIEYLKEAVYNLLNKNQEEQAKRIASKKRELHSINVKLENLEEKYLDEDVDKATFKKWQARYKQEAAVIESYLADASKPLDAVWNEYETELPKLGNLKWLYDQGDVHQKQAFVGMVFNYSLYYQGECYRTPYILPFFTLKAAPMAKKRLLVIEQPQQNSSVLEGSTRDGS